MCIDVMRIDDEIIEQDSYSKRPKFRAKCDYRIPCCLCGRGIKAGEWIRFYGQRLKGGINVWVHFACYINVKSKGVRLEVHQFVPTPRDSSYFLEKVSIRELYKNTCYL